MLIKLLFGFQNAHGTMRTNWISEVCFMINELFMYGEVVRVVQNQPKRWESSVQPKRWESSVLKIYTKIISTGTTIYAVKHSYTFANIEQPL